MQTSTGFSVRRAVSLAVAAITILAAQASRSAAATSIPDECGGRVTPTCATKAICTSGNFDTGCEHVTTYYYYYTK